MASKEEATELHICVLKVSIHCEGCKKKVKKILRNMHGVNSVYIDAQQNKVTVGGDVDAGTLIRRLAKSGKHAEAWPEKKPADASPSSSTKEKNKEKESEAAPEKKKEKKTKTRQPAAEEVAATDKDPPAATISEPDTKPPEKANKSAEPAARPAAETKEAPKPGTKPEKERADTDSETDTEPAETSTKSAGSGKKKGKKQGEPSSSSSNSASASASEGHYGNLLRHQPSPAYQVPVYQHPVYAASHNTVPPMASQSYYYAPVPQSYQQSGHPYSVYNHYNYNHQPPPPPPPSQPEYYRSTNYNYYGSENSYYGSSMEPRSSSLSSPPSSYSYYRSEEPTASPSHQYSSQGSLDMFSDENPNACKVM